VHLEAWNKDTLEAIVSALRNEAMDLQPLYVLKLTKACLSMDCNDANIYRVGACSNKFEHVLDLVHCDLSCILDLACTMMFAVRKNEKKNYVGSEALPTLL